MSTNTNDGQKTDEKKAADNSSTAKKLYNNVEVKNLPKSQVEIKGEITVEVLDRVWPKAVEHVAKHVKIDGFRDGKVPEAMLIKQVGEMAILEEAAEEALREVYPSILIDHKIDAIGIPKVSITKLAKGNPIGFTITTSVVPAFSIKDAYKKKVSKINADKKEVVVTEDDMNNVIKTLRENRARLNKKKEGGEHNHDEHDHGHEGHDHAHEKPEPIEEKDLPVFDDEFAKSIGDFKDVADFKEKVKGQMLKEKEREEKDKRRSGIVEALISESEVELPDLLVDGEVDKMFEQFKGEIEHAGLSFEQYLKEIKKTAEDLKKEWRPSAERRVKMQLALHHIGTTNNIKADEAELAKETEVLLSMYKSADPARVRAYAESVLANEKVFEFLENIK